MEVRYLTKEEHGRSRGLYEEVFAEDEKAFVDAYYCRKTADNRILAAEEDGVIVSMLHCNPYTFRMRGESVLADYIVAVATKVKFRHRGLMRSLLTKALRDMRSEEKPFTFLMPADEAIYLPFDFRLMGNEDEEGLALLGEEELSQMYDLYVQKDALYEKRHIFWQEWETTPMMIRIVHLPSFLKHITADREVSITLKIEDRILEENNGVFWQEWETTPMMIRIVHLPSFLKHITADREVSITLKIEDRILEENNGVFVWTLTPEGGSLCVSEGEPELSVSIADLGSFLCGMLGAEELPGISEKEDGASLRERLESVQPLNGIYINETV